MEEGRFAATATVLKDGRMLVTGGLETFQETARGVRAAEVYDPSTGVWSPAGDIKIIRNSHTASLLPDGMVLIAGGKRYGRMLPEAEIYDPASNTWAQAANLTQARASHAAVALQNGMVLVVGGEAASGAALSTAELYDPATGTWAFSAATP
jgi:hypothetical protein